MVTLVKEWTDDHIMCCSVNIDGKLIELWWCGWEGLAAAMYANDCGRAMDDLRRIVKAQEESDAADSKGADDGSR